MPMNLRIAFVVFAAAVLFIIRMLWTGELYLVHRYG